MKVFEKIHQAYCYYVLKLPPSRHHQPRLFRRSGLDRRQYLRVRSHDLIKFSPQLFDEHIERSDILSRIYDVSEGGLRLFSPVPIRIGTDFQVSVNFMEGSRVITAAVHTRWTRPARRSRGRYNHVGISFVTLDTDDCIAIRNWIMTREEIPDRRSK